MTEGRDERPAWALVIFFTLAGFLILLVGWYTKNFWQGVLVNIGTSLLLFAGLALAEGRLVKKIALASERSNAAQRYMRDVLYGERPSRREAVQRALDAVGHNLNSAGLMQTGATVSGNRSALNFADLEGKMTWKVGYGPSLFHEVVSVDGHSRCWPAKGEKYVTVDGAPLSEEEERILRDFQIETSSLLNHFANLISKHKET